VTVRPLPLALALLTAAGCGSNQPAFNFNTDASVRRDAVADVAPEGGATPLDVPAIPVDVPTVLDNVRVFAHSSDSLYAVNPRTYGVVRIGLFQWPADGNDHRMTDIAVNAQGDIWGITFGALYRVDPTNARCTYVADFDGVTVNGLSFVPADEFQGGTEQLIAADRAGFVYRVDTTTGRTTQYGMYGDGVGSSGDIVSVLNAGTFATVVSDGIEYLARVNPMTGRATLIGPTNQTETWGLGYWRGSVYGFTSGGLLVLIDITTGRATPEQRTGPPWWGAGVTTLAPTAPP
jgi:hypothetical protein